MEKVRLYFVDNASTDASLEFVRSSKIKCSLTVIRNKRNLGFAKANNLVFPKCKAPFIALLNNDTRLHPDWLIRLVERMGLSSDIGIACSRRIPDESPRYIDPDTLEISWCSGGQSLIRRKALEQVGYFDEKFFMYGEDVDLSWRMWLGGYRLVYVPESICEHHFGKEEKYKTRRIYFHVRNSILLRYAYGSFADIKKAYWRWIKEGAYNILRKMRLGEGCAILLALPGHLPYVFYFLKKKKTLITRENFQSVKNIWISL
jgi:GT2 family glycosyltransferase